MIDIKKNKIIMGLFLLFVLLIGEAIAFFIFSGKYEATYDNYKSTVDALEMVRNNANNVNLSPRYVEKVTQYKKEIEGVYEQAIYTFKNAADKSIVLKPLEFKEKLNELDVELSQYKITIPKAVGFSEYQSFALPVEAQMRSLTRQLSFIKNVINILIESNVESITEIERLAIETVRENVNNEKIFDAYHFFFSFRISHKNLMSFFDKLLSTPSLIQIKDLNIKNNYFNEDASIESMILSVNLDLYLMEYNNEVPGNN